MASFREVVTSKGERRWEFQVRKKGLQRTGRARILQNAQALARKAEDALDIQIATGITGDKTVADAIRRYLKTELNDHAESDRRNIRARLAWWTERIGSARLCDLRPATIRRAWDQVDGSPGTCNRYLANLSKVLSVATREWQWLPANPCRALKRRRESDGRVRMLTDNERGRLLGACAARPRLRAMVLFALKTGCRLGELEELHSRDVLPDRQVARIRHSKSGQPRTVHVPADVLEALYALRARRDGLVFGKLDRRGWRAAKKAAGLVDWRFHDLRHDFASRLGRRGASESLIAAALGHKTWAMARRYTHHSPEELAELVRGFL